MGIHLLIVAEEEPFQGAFRVAYERAIEVTDSFYRRKCVTPADIVTAVHSLAIERGQRIDVLDIFGHGGPGQQHLRDGTVVFGVGNAPTYNGLTVGKDIAQRLRRYLAMDARVRLLGCKTALEEAGRALLVSLQEELGQHVVVFGTNEKADAFPKPAHDGDLDQSEFGERGFRDIREEAWLFSSTEARGGICPPQSERIAANRAWYRSLHDS